MKSVLNDMAEQLQADDRILQSAVPHERSVRLELRRAVRQYAQTHVLVPPLSLGELQHRSRAVLAETCRGEEHLPYVTVLMNNESWWERLSGVPYDRRLLLIPQCLRDADNCPADVDQFGMICRRCGRCVIHELIAEAETLGYATLIAEGTVVVTSLIRSRKIEAVVGVGCLSSLARIFPYTEAAALPGVAIPLLRDGCRNTSVDTECVREAMGLTGPERIERLDLQSLREVVDGWFSPDVLREVLGAVSGQTERIARDWIAAGGKRWRPFLLVCTHQALCGDPQGEASAQLRQVAIALECFHKASLVHDDIEDDDEFRYARKTLHRQYGVPVALNVGDFLLGEGYRLLSGTDAPSQLKAKMLAAAAQAHRKLSLGQGSELCWKRDPHPLDPEQVIEIYAGKTSAAFEVSVQLGAILAAAERDVFDALGEFCGALGVAYQIRDDLDDLSEHGPAGDGPSLIYAIAAQRARRGSSSENLWDRRGEPEKTEIIEKFLSDPEVRAEGERLFQDFRFRAIDSLQLLRNPDLKSLLRRAVAKIFREIDTQEQPVDLKVGHA
jgi:geranylgeranyl pyrophosphate synthase